MNGFESKVRIYVSREWSPPRSQLNMLSILRWAFGGSWLMVWLLIFWCNNWYGFKRYLLDRSVPSPIPIAGTLIGAGVAWLLPGPLIMRRLLFWMALCGTDLPWMLFSMIETLGSRFGRR